MVEVVETLRFPKRAPALTGRVGMEMGMAEGKAGLVDGRAREEPAHSVDHSEPGGGRKACNAPVPTEEGLVERRHPTQVDQPVRFGRLVVPAWHPHGMDDPAPPQVLDRETAMVAPWFDRGDETEGMRFALLALGEVTGMGEEHGEGTIEPDVGPQLRLIGEETLLRVRARQSFELGSSGHGVHPEGGGSCREDVTLEDGTLVEPGGSSTSQEAGTSVRGAIPASRVSLISQIAAPRLAMMLVRTRWVNSRPESSVKRLSKATSSGVIQTVMAAPPVADRLGASNDWWTRRGEGGVAELPNRCRWTDGEAAMGPPFPAIQALTTLSCLRSTCELRA